jgi:hypothetical protein
VHALDIATRPTIETPVTHVLMDPPPPDSWPGSLALITALAPS